MSYTIENVNSCTKKIVFNFETLDLTDEIKAAVAKKQKSVNLKGFRKGKAPLSMVQQMYGPQIETEALNQFVQAQFFDAVNKEKLRIVGYPTFEDVKYDSGKSVSFNALVEIFPTVELKDYSSLKFSKDKVEVTDKELEDIKNNYLSSKAEMVEVEGDAALEKGQTAVMNFEGVKEDGSRPDNMKGSEFLLEIGSGQFIPGFEDGMIGMKVGAKRDVKVTFPEDYHAEELKGAPVTFEVELLEIKEKKVPELTDELAKEFGFESVEDFNTKNRKTLTAQKERQASEKLHQEILEKLVEENSFEVPLALINQQKEALRKDLEHTLKQQGFNDQMMDEYFDKWTEDMDKKAAFQVRSGLILDTLARKYEIEATEEDFSAKIKEAAEHSGATEEQIKQYYTSNEQIKRNMMYAIREEKTFKKLCEDMVVA